MRSMPSSLPVPMAIPEPTCWPPFRAALAEAEAAADPSADRVAQAISFGALMGARGQLGRDCLADFRGMADGLAASIDSTGRTWRTP